MQQLRVQEILNLGCAIASCKNVSRVGVADDGNIAGEYQGLYTPPQYHYAAALPYFFRHRYYMGAKVAGDIGQVFFFHDMSSFPAAFCFRLYFIFFRSWAKSRKVYNMFKILRNLWGLLVSAAKYAYYFTTPPGHPLMYFFPCGKKGCALANLDNSVSSNLVFLRDQIRTARQSKLYLYKFKPYLFFFFLLLFLVSFRYEKKKKK